MYKLMPQWYKKKIKNLMTYSGSNTDPAMFCNYSLSISAALGFVVSYLINVDLFFFWAVLTAGIFGLFHGFLLLAVDKRTKFVESILPDVLQIIAANVRSGFIPSRAILLSARKEFGPLSEAIRNVGKEMLTGRSLQESLDEFTKTIKSDILERTVILLKKGTISGGQLVSLFEETARDMRRRETIKKEVTANILMYAIFIGFAGCVGAPLLYGLSSHLVMTIGSMGEDIYIPEDYSSNLPLMNFGIEVSPEFLLWFSVAAIAITTIFSGILIGLIGSGKEKAGIKYIPILMAISFVVFYTTRLVVGSLFAAIIPS